MNKFQIPLGQLDYKKAEINLRASSPAEMYRLKACEKEPKTVEWLEAFAEDDIFYDVGANVGAYSLIGATKLNGKGKVYAFEPAAPTYAALVTNVVANKKMAKIVALPIAFGAKNELSFVGLSSMEPGAASHHQPTSQFPQPFIVMTMDSFIEDYKIPVPTKVKIDVDGVELTVLKGMKKTLADPKLKEVLIEVKDDAVQERFAIENIFRANGFVMKAKHTLISSLNGNVWNRLYVRAG